MTPLQIKTLNIARYQFTLADRELSSRSDYAHCAGIDLLQSAIETFLVCLSDHVNARVKDEASLNQYLDAIDEKIAPATIPFRKKLFRINRLRVSSKHHAIPPPHDEIPELLAVARTFIEEVCAAHMQINFWTVSFSDSLSDGDVKDALHDAETSFQKQDFRACLLACRKSVYLLFEKDYDIRPFETGEKPQGLLGPHSRAPFYTCNQEYIQKSVRQPSDYIVLDYQDLEHRLLVCGIDPTAFWNIRRLTPDAYRRADKTWVFSLDLDHFDAEQIRSRAEYVLARTEEIAVSEHYTRTNQLTLPSSHTCLRLKSKGVPVYEKADASSTIATRTADNLEFVTAQHCTKGLHDDTIYWSVCNMESQFFFGFIRDEDVEKVEQDGQQRRP